MIKPHRLSTKFLSDAELTASGRIQAARFQRLDLYPNAKPWANITIELQVRQARQKTCLHAPV
jgi:hypothetical protein